MLTYGLWDRLLSQAWTSRPELLRVAGDLSGWAVALTGRAAEAEEIATAIHEVCGWFP